MKIINGELVHFDPGVVMGPEFLDLRDLYAEFIAKKSITCHAAGLTDIPPLNAAMFPHQLDVTRWALRLGKAAAFLGTGLGKTLIELEWARVVAEHTGEAVMVLAPLAVARQTVREAQKFGLAAHYCADVSEVTKGVNVTNYERMDKFEPEEFAGIVLDESSILKSFDGKTRSALIDAFKQTPYRLAATATPAPNDYMELGNHAEFLGVMTATEMLSTFFVHDGGETQKWRLKGHARKEFWKWVCSWAVSINKPSDIGHSDEGFVLPPLVYHEHVLDVTTPSEGMLFAMPAETLGERLGARRASVGDRVRLCYELISEHRREESEKASISERVLPIESGEVQAGSKAKGRGKRGSSAEIRDGRGASGEDEGIGASGDKKESRDEGSVSAQEILANSRATPGSDEVAVAQMRDMRLLGHEQCELLSSGGSLPQDEEGSRLVMRELQSGFGEVQGQHGTAAASGSIPDKWLVWCNLNDEQDAIYKLLRPDCVSIDGRTDNQDKLDLLDTWLFGDTSCLVSKPKVFGFGMNLQVCSHVVFVGVTDSWEAFYQSVRRCYRFGQKNPVHIHIIAASTEGNVLENLKRKEKEAKHMAEEMVANMQDLTRMALRGTVRQQSVYEREVRESENWTVHLADCVDLAEELPSDSMHYSIFSPPFASLYTYSASERDMGNCKTHDEFWEHYKFLIKESFRVMMPGRLVSIHCMNLPTSKVRDGHIGIRDFRGEIIRAYEEVGFIYHSEVCIWKDPVTAMQRTKALGLLHKTIRKDSSMSRQGVPDYLVTMRKPGENTEPISHSKEDFPVELWQNYASPIWMDINPSDTLQYRSAREHEDERHICPLQLEVIRRGVKLWSNPGDTVWSPFTGIGSEGFVALEMGRKFIGSELKLSYYRQACKNLGNALSASTGLFAKDYEEEAIA